MHRLWLKPAVGLLSKAGADTDSAVKDLGPRAVRDLVSKLQQTESSVTPVRRLRAHSTLSLHAEGQIEAWGHDVSVARHADVVWSRMPATSQWAAVNHVSLPRSHLGALFSLKLGTAPLAKNADREQLVTGRLCPFCAVRGLAFIEDEAHICFDCSAYEDLRFTWARALRLVKPSFRVLAEAPGGNQG